MRINRILGEPTDRNPNRDPDPLTLIPLHELAPVRFANWRDRRLSEVSTAAVLREWNLLSAVCSRAERDWGWLSRNPMSKLSRPKSPPPRTRRVTDKDIEKILQAAGHRPGQPPKTVSQRIALAFLFALETAMRAGEICALRRDDIDLVQRVAHVRANERGARKTGTGRTVPLSKRAVEILRQALAADGADDRVFGLNAQNMSAMFRRIRLKAKIEDLHFHDTRAEALTRLSRKLDVMQLARVSGHRDLKLGSSTFHVDSRIFPAGLAIR